MSKVSVFNPGWIDLVFEGRNKEYGAYKLRKEDPKTTLIALISGVALLFILIGIPAAINHFGNKQPAPEKPTVIDGTVVLSEVPLKKPEPPKPPKAEPPAQAAATAPASSTRQEKFLPPVAAPNVPTDVALPSIEDFKNANPSSHNDEGDNKGNIAIGSNGSSTGTENGTGTTPSVGDDDLVSSYAVDKMPAYPGGIKEFYDRVAQNFRPPHTDTALTLKVYVSFIIEKDGTMSNIKVLKDPGYNLGNEAVRVLKSIKTKWEPGYKNGKKVRTAYNFPITVNIK
ncbi:energy transducer TonB [Flavobacterium sp. MK4S-17]|uniref:energy transducer TonB n=1 Tax=Flavobacterium sp. MK4S-17 TaxID=2543737 RepID=UPI0013590DC2|nr:energy transducer TonB [Flavobacterium sp. MK4S-17]